MIIDGKTITEAIDTGLWKAWRNEKVLESKDLKISTNSVDLTLGSKMLVPVCHDKLIDPSKDTLEWREVLPDNGKYYFLPGQFALAVAQERFDVSNPVPVFLWEDLKTEGKRTFMYCAPMFEGRSTTARLGLATHVTTGYGDYGFAGNFTMELVNHGPLGLILSVGMRIAQLSFHVVTPRVREIRYTGAYAGKIGGPFPPTLGQGRF